MQGHEGHLRGFIVAVGVRDQTEVVEETAEFIQACFAFNCVFSFLIVKAFGNRQKLFDIFQTVLGFQTGSLNFQRFFIGRFI